MINHVLDHLIQDAIRLCDPTKLLPNKSDANPLFSDISKKLNALHKQTSIDPIKQNKLVEYIRSILNEIKNASWSEKQLTALKNSFEQLYFIVTGIPPLTEAHTDDELRNINSFEYLRNFVGCIPESLLEKNVIFKFVNSADCFEQYHPDTPYGDFYTMFLGELEESFEKCRKELNEKKESSKPYLTEQLNLFDALIDLVYNNPNLALERSYDMVKEALKNTVHTDPSAVEKAMHKHLKGDKKPVQNKTTPTATGSSIGLLLTNISKTYKPQNTTSQAMIRSYHYTTHSTSKQLPREVRYGTQAQLVEGKERISPLYAAWLEMKTRTATKNDSIQHVYFNFLLMDSKGIPLKDPLHLQERESTFTSKLHEMETNYPCIAVITLPADRGLLSHHALDKRERTLAFVDAFKCILSFDESGAIINGVKQSGNHSTASKSQDFYISDPIRKRLFKLENGFSIKDNENVTFNNLLITSFDKLGLLNQPKLSEADIHAVCFHFIKYEIPNFILTTLGPESFNMSCKDAIDRGGVSSAYYNLMKSIEQGTPMSRAEFEQALHAAPILVKGRGMNFHIKNLWNAIDAYLNAQIKPNPAIPAWLYDWRNQNALPHTIHYYLKQLDALLEPPTSTFQSFFTNKLLTSEESLFILRISEELKKHLAGPFNREAYVLNCSPNEDALIKKNKALNAISKALIQDHLVKVEVVKVPVANTLKQSTY